MDDPIIRLVLSLAGTAVADMLAGWARRVMDGWRRGTP